MGGGERENAESSTHGGSGSVDNDGNGDGGDDDDVPTDKGKRRFIISVDIMDYLRACIINVTENKNRPKISHADLLLLYVRYAAVVIQPQLILCMYIISLN